MSWELIVGLLPFLLLLACPLSMFWMMRGMPHGGSCGRKLRAENEGLQLIPVPVRSRDEEIRALRARISELEARNYNVLG